MGEDTQSRAELLEQLERLREQVADLEGKLNPTQGALPSVMPAPAPSSSERKREVSCRVMLPFLRSMSARGASVELLAHGAGLPADQLADPSAWMDWEQFCVVSRNVMRFWGEERLQGMGQELLDVPVLRGFAVVGRMLPSTYALYEWAGRQLMGPGGLLFRCVDYHGERVAPGRYSFQLNLPAGYTHNPAFFMVVEACLRAMPGLAGHGEAQVTSQATKGGATFEVALGQRRGMRDELLSLARGLVSRSESNSLREAHELLMARNSELQSQVSERHRVTEALSASEKRFRIFSELTNDYCYMARFRDGVLSCEWITGSYTESTGFSQDDLKIRGLHGAVQAEDQPHVQRMLEEVATGESVVHEFRINTQSGQVRWMREHLRPEPDPDGEGLRVYGAARDVTDRRVAEAEQANLEAQLRQSQKMDAVGRLAGGVAHDFNNLLTVILTHCGFLLNELPPDTQLHDDASDIQAAARRAAGLTQRLLAFSRQQVLTPRVLEINTVVRDLEPMLTSLTGEGIELDIQLDPEPGQLKADRAQLEQIVLNLVVNARDAMPKGGRLTIASGLVEIQEDYVRQHPEAQTGPHVALGVRDTGVGMDEETLARIFEPFFTTKEQGKGTGLGLSTVYGIVKQSGGSIHVESEQGFGTTFEVFFPAVEEAVRREPSVRPRSERAPRQSTILVVEDEEGVRRGVQRILKHAGYQVLVAADPAQAIAIVEDYEEDLDLLLTDIVMPMMNGLQLAERVVAMRDDIKVLYMSGYTSDTVDTDNQLDPAVEFLQKPFTRQAMLTKVADILNDAHASSERDNDNDNDDGDSGNSAAAGE